MRPFNFLNIIVLICLAFVFYDFTCGPCAGYYVENRVGLELKVSPNKEIYAIDDTLWLETKFDNVIPLINRDGTAEMGTSSLRIFSYQWSDSTKLEDLQPERYLLLKKENGIITSIYNSIYQTTINCNDNECELSLGFIPKETGFYIFHLAESNFDNLDYYKCRPENILVPQFDTENHNFELLNPLQYPSTINHQDTAIVNSWQGNMATYTFIVE